MNNLFIEMLEDKEFQIKLCEAINKSVDIPLLNEDTEAIIFQTLITTLVEVIKSV